MRILTLAVFVVLLGGCANAQFDAASMQRSSSANLRSSVSEQVLHFFTGPPDGALPSSGHLVFDSAGNMYGATRTGGTGGCSFRGTVIGCGTVFELTPIGSGWSERILYSFKNLNDGAAPWNTVTLDNSGDIYGVTTAGGNRGCVPLSWTFPGCGTAFELVHQGSHWKKLTLHIFSGAADGGNPDGSVVLDASGNLYGAAYCGGAAYTCYYEGSGFGTFFQLKAGTGSFRPIRVLHAFERQHLGGVGPNGDLTVDSAGHIYGMADNIYEMVHSGSRWHFNQLILLGNNKFAQGLNPTGGPAFDASGNIYGMMGNGGDSQCNCGLVFEAAKSASGYHEQVLYVFTGGSDGAYPQAGITLDSSGQLYGATDNGGDLRCNNGGGCGVAFVLKAAGSKSSEQVLHTFENDATDGGMPSGTLVFDRLGNLYGTTGFGGSASGYGFGSVFQISP